MSSDTCITFGVFDLFHSGHLSLLNRASKLCAELHVGIQSALDVADQKGRNPICSDTERLDFVGNLPTVHDAFLYSRSSMQVAVIERSPDAIIQGGDFLETGDRSSFLRFLKSVRVELIVLPKTHSISTTELISRCRQTCSMRERGDDRF